ncbi:MAG: MFS transporter [Promethearchaeota archaeon]
MGGTSVSIGLPDYIVELAGNAVAYGWVLGIFTIVQTVFQTPVALLSDRIGRKIMLLIGMGIYLIGTILCSFATTVPQLLVFRAIQGAGAYSSILLSIVSDRFHDKSRTRALSYYLMSMTGGYMLGNIFGGLIVTWVGIRGIFYVSATLIGIAMIIVVFLLPETNTFAIGISRAVNRGDQQEGLDSHANITRDWSFLRNIEFIFALFLNAVRSFCISGIIAYQVWLFTQEFQISEFNTSLILIPLTLVYLTGIYLAPRFSKKWGILNLILYSSIAFVVSGIFVLMQYILWWYIVFSILGGFFLGVMEPEIISFAQSYLPETARGMGNGVFNTVGFLFSALGQIIIPAISYRWGYFGVNGTLLVIWLLMSALVWIIKKKYH